ncbi:MAG: UvrD-helicase domain-containing protein [Verrucomicrobiae bacterium]|nr:UvrD-helicase domain-containing protein [Verrucomicrobiae bacterium]
MADGHAFVWASAGTGKTHTLTLRALHLLLQAPFDPRAAGAAEAGLYADGLRASRLEAARAVIRRFVLTTFTRKAAAEMQGRLHRYLESLGAATSRAALAAETEGWNNKHGDSQFLEVVDAALGRGADFAALTRGAAALAERAAELQVVTLHSYAAAILRRHPISAGLPPNVEFAEEDDGLLPDPKERLVNLWLERVLADPRLLEWFEKLLPAVPLDEQRAWFTTLLDDPWIAETLDFPAPPKKDLDALLAFFRDLTGALGSAPERYSAIHAARQDLSARCEAAAAGTKGAWWELLRSLERHGKTWFGKTQAVQKARDAHDPQGRWLGEENGAKSLLVRQILAMDRAKEWTLWRGFCAAFCDWAKDAVLRELNLVTFNEMVRRAAELLQKDAAARRAERRRLWALLVDEFQDTDPLQLDILQSLLTPEEGETHQVLGFFVGDRKQSIYRFRRADLPAIEAFVRGYATRIGVSPSDVAKVTLRASFRTRPSVLEFVNHFFERCVPLPNYPDERLVAVRDEPGPKVEWRVFAPPEKMNAGARRAAAANEVARIIADHAGAPEGRSERLREVLVLVPTHQEINALLPVLEKAGIPAISVGTKTFFARHEVLDALNLLLALHAPLDGVAVAGVLRSPLVGLSDPEIHRLLKQLVPEKIFHGVEPLTDALDAGAVARIEAARTLARERLRLPLGEWLTRVRGFIPEGVYAAGDGEGRAMARVERVLEIFRRTAQSDVLPPLVWLTEQRARANRAEVWNADLGEDVGANDERAPAVRVMTIHKAKGLEGEFVIVLGWSKALEKCRPKRKAPPALCMTGGDGNPLRGFSLNWGGLKVVSPGYAAAQAEDSRAQAKEGRRLLYVAATRAKDRMILVSEEAPDFRKGVLSETACDGDLAAALDGHAIPGDFDGGDGARLCGEKTPAVRDPEAWAKFWKARLAEAQDPPRPLVRRPTRAEHPEEEESFDAEDVVMRKREEFREAARLAGVFVHAYLERHLLDEAYDPAKLAKVVEAQRSEGEVARGREKAARILGKFYGSSNHGRVRAARTLGQEVPIYLQAEGEAWNGVVDLVFEEKGRIVGVDFKTMPKPAELRDEYAAQERLYTQALRALAGGREVAFEFWWLEA